METIATKETEEIKEVTEEEVPAEIMERIPTSPEEDEDAKAKLVQEIKVLMYNFPNLGFIKVKGHSGIKENEVADFLATSAIKKKDPL